MSTNEQARYTAEHVEQIAAYRHREGCHTSGDMLDAYAATLRQSDAPAGVVSDAIPNDDTGHEFAKRHGLFIYEVDFGGEGKGRYIRLNDFNRVVAALSAPEPAAQVDVPKCPAYLVGMPATTVWAHAWIAGNDAASAPPAQPAERVPEATTEMVEAAAKFAHDHELPAKQFYRGLWRAMCAASPAPSESESEGGKGVNDTLARELYIASQCDAHNLHTLAWHELTEKQRDEWRKNATGAAR